MATLRIPCALWMLCWQSGDPSPTPRRAALPCKPGAGPLVLNAHDIGDPMAENRLLAYAHRAQADHAYSRAQNTLPLWEAAFLREFWYHVNAAARARASYLTPNPVSLTRTLPNDL